TPTTTPAAAPTPVGRATHRSSGAGAVQNRPTPKATPPAAPRPSDPAEAPAAAPRAAAGPPASPGRALGHQKPHPPGLARGHEAHRADHPHPQALPHPPDA